MGDLAIDTAVTSRGDGLFEATLSAEWEIWGPMGGYVAACALRAAGASTEHARPAAFSCHYLGVARVRSRRHSCLDAQGRSLGRVAAGRDHAGRSPDPRRDGVEHERGRGARARRDGDARRARTGGPAGDAGADARRRRGAVPVLEQPSRPSRSHFDQVDGRRRVPVRPAGREWLRFVPTASFDDPWIDATRAVILVDLPSWPAAHRPHAYKQPPFIAPTLDLNVAFHQPTSGEEWLLCDGAAPLSTGGLFGWTARLWSPAGKLHASGGGQCLYRRIKSPG